MNSTPPNDADHPDADHPDVHRPDVVQPIVVEPVAADAADPGASGSESSGSQSDASLSDEQLLRDEDLDPALLDGHTVDDLSDYLDAGMVPADPGIDDSPACQNALAAIARVRAASRGALDVAALDETAVDEDWVSRILANISLEARAGRDIPFRSTAPTQHGVITEGTVRSLLREAGDTVDGILVGKCSLEGDVTALGEPIRVRITASVLWGNPIHEVVDRLRAAVMHELLEHTELVVDAIDVEIRDVLLDRAPVPSGIEPTDPEEAP